MSVPHIPRRAYLTERQTAVSLVVAGMVLALAGRSGTHSLGGRSTAATREAQARASFAQLPLSFEPNQGQTDAAVRFLARGAGYGMLFTPKEAVLTLSTESRKAGASRAERRDATVRMRLAGANAAPRVSGVEPLPGRVNYIIGKDRSRWHSNVPTFNKLRYDAVYPGVDLVYYGNQRNLEYDFIVKPGADPAAIGLQFPGSAHPTLDAQGNLSIPTDGGAVIQHRPVVYQQVAGQRRTVECGYLVTAGAEPTVRFQLGDYDHSRPLVIDPTLAYSTYFGGSGRDEAFGVATDSAGNAYVSGTTASTDLRTTKNAYDTAGNGGSNAFVAKLNPAGNSLIYCTYLGGNGDDIAKHVAVFEDQSTLLSYAYVAGTTTSPDFPTTNQAAQPDDPDAVYNSHGKLLYNAPDAFLTKLNPTGGFLLYSSYLGGDNEDDAKGLALDGIGVAYVAGDTTSDDFPTTAGAFSGTLQQSGNSQRDVFVAEVDPFQSGAASLLYASYFGGSGEDFGQSIAVDAFGSAYVTGQTASLDLPVSPAAYQQQGDVNGIAYVAKFDPTQEGSFSLAYSTYLGSPGDSLTEAGNGIAVDGDGSAYVTGVTNSPNFPVTGDAYQDHLVRDAQSALTQDAFLAKLTPDATDLLYSTFLGGSRNDVATAVSLDSSGNAYVTGATNSLNFPVKNFTDSGINNTGSGKTDLFVFEIDTTQSQAASLVFSTFVGSPDGEVPHDVAVDASGNVYVAGFTDGARFPTTAKSFDRTYGGKGDAFILKLTPLTLTGIQVQEIDASSATISWSTSSPSSSKVLFGLTSTYGSEMSDDSLTTEHFVTLTGLQPRTLYHFQCASSTVDSATARSTDLTFVTAPDGLPQFDVTVKSTRDGSLGKIRLTVTLVNTGDGDAANFRFIRARLQGAGHYVGTTTPLPKQLNTIHPGDSRKVKLLFPSNTASKGAHSRFILEGIYDGGVFSRNINVRIP